MIDVVAIIGNVRHLHRFIHFHLDETTAYAYAHNASTLLRTLHDLIKEYITYTWTEPHKPLHHTIKQVTYRIQSFVFLLFFLCALLFI